MMPKYQRQRIDKEYRRLVSLAEHSDLIDFHRIQPDHYLIHFRCRGLIEDPRAGLEITSHHVVSVRIPKGRGEPFGPDSVAFVRPGNIFHPNIRPPSIALQKYLTGKTLDEFCQRIYDVITFRNYALDGNACVNHEAADWVREHPDMLPLDQRPLVTSNGKKTK